MIRDLFKRRLVVMAIVTAVSACAANGGDRFGLPASTPASYAAASQAAADRLTQVCLPTVFEDQSFEQAVRAAGLDSGVNPFNERVMMFPQTSFTSGQVPRLHVFHSVTGGDHMCTIFALDGDPQAVLDLWQAELRSAQTRRGLGGEPVTLPAYGQLADAQPRFIRIGEALTLVVSSDAQTARVVSNSGPGYRTLRPATGVLMTVVAPASGLNLTDS